MSKVASTRLASLLIESIGRASAPVLLHDQVAQLAIDDQRTQSLNEALEYVEPLLEKIRDIVRNKRNVAMLEGVTWDIELFGSDEEWVRGAAFQDSSLPKGEQSSRERRAFVTEVKAEILALSFSEFERACTTVLKKLGCSNSWTSPQRDDGGIDFYGKLSLKGRLNADLPLGGIDSKVNVWLVGQAKHYPTNAIQTSVIREMVGSVELARTGGAIHSWDGLSIRPFDAVVMFVFTTGKFSSGSKALLAKSGMLAMNGEQLATFLCDIGLGFEEEPTDFDRVVFRSELLSQN